MWIHFLVQEASYFMPARLGWGVFLHPHLHCNIISSCNLSDYREIISNMTFRQFISQVYGTKVQPVHVLSYVLGFNIEYIN